MAQRGRPRIPRKFTVNGFSNMIGSQLRPKVQKAVYKVIADDVKAAMKESINQNMYKAYTPSVYERRENRKGLLDSNNIKIRRSYIKSDTNEFSNTKRYIFHVNAANLAKSVPLRDFMPEFGYNMITGSHIPYQTAINSTITSKAQDLLYYWKDQGLVYNLFADPNFSRWGSPRNFNKGITDILFKQRKLRFHLIRGRMKTAIRQLETKIK